MSSRSPALRNRRSFEVNTKYTIPLALFTAIGVLAVSYWSACSWELRGQRGDFFGGHTAAITGVVSIILLWLTFREQRRQLEEQSKELIETRQHLVQELEYRRSELDLLKAQTSLLQHDSVISQLRSVVELQINAAFSAEQAPQSVLGQSRKQARQLISRAQELTTMLLSSTHLSDAERRAWEKLLSDIRPSGDIPQ